MFSSRADLSLSYGIHTLSDEEKLIHAVSVYDKYSH